MSCQTLQPAASQRSGEVPMPPAMPTRRPTAHCPAPEVRGFSSLRASPPTQRFTEPSSPGAPARAPPLTLPPQPSAADPRLPPAAPAVSASWRLPKQARDAKRREPSPSPGAMVCSNSRTERPAQATSSGGLPRLPLCACAPPARGRGAPPRPGPGAGLAPAPPSQAPAGGLHCPLPPALAEWEWPVVVGVGAPPHLRTFPQQRPYPSYALARKITGFGLCRS